MNLIVRLCMYPHSFTSVFISVHTWEIMRRQQYPVAVQHHRVFPSLLLFHILTSFLKVRNLIPVICKMFTLLFRPLFLPVCECPPHLAWTVAPLCSAATFAVLPRDALSAYPGFLPSPVLRLPSPRGHASFPLGLYLPASVCLPTWMPSPC